MGYLTNIIKDSRLNLAAGPGTAQMLPDPAPQMLPAGLEAGTPVSADPSRQAVPPRPETPAGRPALSPGNPLPAPNAEIDYKPGRPVPQAIPPQTKSRAGDESTASEKLIQTAGLHRTPPIIRRQVRSAATTGPSAAAAPTTGGSQPTSSQPSGRKAAKRPPAGRIAASSRPPEAAAGQLAAKPAAREIPSAESNQAVAARQGTQPLRPQVAVAESTAANDAFTRDGRSDLSAAAAQTPGPARLSGATARPVLPASLAEAGRPVEAVNNISANSPAGPRVQIGQVNVIVEETRVPPKSQPNERRSDDSASRTFLRSL